MWILEDRRLLFATKTDLATSEWVKVLVDQIQEVDNENSPFNYS
jgi:hypothetical protein